MATLFLRMDAPMQAWGIQSNFSHRDAGREPSKSGVVGLLCAALGRAITEPIDDLASLRMAVRIDQHGVVRRDYHTAGKEGYYKVSGAIERNSLMTSERYYLSDAKFLVGLEGEEAFLLHLHNALRRPQWFLFLGRKAFLPSERVWSKEGVSPNELVTALAHHQPLAERISAPQRWEIMIDDPNGSTQTNDYPVSFSPRRFMPRRLTRQWVDNPHYEPTQEA